MAALPLAAAVSAPAPIMLVPVPEQTGRAMIRTTVEDKVGIDVYRNNVDHHDTAVIPSRMPMPVISVCSSHRCRAKQQSAQAQYRNSMQKVGFHFRILSVRVCVSRFIERCVNRADAVSHCIRFRSDPADGAIWRKFTQEGPL